MQRSKVLVVDDSLIDREILKAYLESNFDVFIACDGGECLASVTDVKPDIVLMDIMMPDLDGYELFGLIRTNPLTRNIPIIFISGLHISTFEEKYPELEEYNLLRKPVMQEELIQKIMQVLKLGIYSDKIEKLG